MGTQLFFLNALLLYKELSIYWYSLHYCYTLLHHILLYYIYIAYILLCYIHHIHYFIMYIIAICYCYSIHSCYIKNYLSGFSCKHKIRLGDFNLHVEMLLLKPFHVLPPAPMPLSFTLTKPLPCLYPWPCSSRSFPPPYSKFFLNTTFLPFPCHCCSAIRKGCFSNVIKIATICRNVFKVHYISR